ncbi:hypothetical protein BJ878DRAFT_495831 [Calycina marina]|uniref:Uncharacterized protein n=1 Tax=Calycina marina TaxID=1763456 RepID=A0A9P8CGY1_9HELO|nr:hypothetical protein BJ878DRAFT_495831 [Calycina marina]
MRGYTDIMACAEVLNGNGTKVTTEEGIHALWQPKSPSDEPHWYLRISVMNDHEIRGDCPNRLFLFKSQKSLTRAAEKIDTMFGDAVTIRKCGINFPNAMGGRVNDGRCEHITIDYDSNSPGAVGWQNFLSQLTELEAGWERDANSQ